MTNTIQYHLYLGSNIQHKMNLSTEKKQTHGRGEQNCGCYGEGEGVGWTGNWG